MKEFVELPGARVPMRNSLILIGSTFRTFSTLVTHRVLPCASVHRASPMRSPFKGLDPEVTWKVALTLAPVASGPATSAGRGSLPERREVHCRLGREMLNMMSVTGASAVLVNVTVVAWEDRGEKF